MVRCLLQAQTGQRSVVEKLDVRERYEATLYQFVRALSLVQAEVGRMHRKVRDIAVRSN